MPLDQVPARGDRDHDTGPSVRTEVSSHVLGEGLGGALGEIEEQLSALSEDPAQETRHGDDDMTMRDGGEDLLIAASRSIGAASSCHMGGRSFPGGTGTGTARSSGTSGTKAWRSHVKRRRT